MPGPSSCCPWLRLDARGAVGVLTEAALPPVVVGQAVVALGPRGAFFAFTVAGLVAAVVQGADLVAVTFWPKTAPSGLVLPMDFVPADVPLGDAGDLGRARLHDMGGPWESLRSPGAGRTRLHERGPTAQTQVQRPPPPMSKQLLLQQCS